MNTDLQRLSREVSDAIERLAEYDEAAEAGFFKQWQELNEETLPNVEDAGEAFRIMDAFLLDVETVLGAYVEHCACRRCHRPVVDGSNYCRADLFKRARYHGMDVEEERADIDHVADAVSVLDSAGMGTRRLNLVALLNEGFCVRSAVKVSRLPLDYS